MSHRSGKQQDIDELWAKVKQKDPDPEAQYELGSIYYFRRISTGLAHHDDPERVGLELLLDSGYAGNKDAIEEIFNIAKKGENSIFDEQYTNHLAAVISEKHPALALKLYDDAIKHLRLFGTRGEFDLIKNAIGNMAEQGNMLAQKLLGDIYNYGISGQSESGQWYSISTRSQEDAIKWYKKSMAQGNCNASYELAMIYEFGIAQNGDDAYKCYLFSAEHGVKEAQFKLGECHHYGEYTDQNKSKAAEWYKKAADKGHARSMSMLGMLYLYGEGVKKSIDEAYGLFCQSIDSDRRDVFALMGLGRCMYFGKFRQIDWEAYCGTYGFDYLDKDNLPIKKPYDGRTLPGDYYWDKLLELQQIDLCEHPYANVFYWGMLACWKEEEDDRKMEISSILNNCLCMAASIVVTDREKAKPPIEDKLIVQTIRSLSDDGNILAHVVLARLISFGYVTSLDNESKTLFEQASDNEDIFATYYLAEMSYKKHQTQEAIELFNRVKSIGNILERIKHNNKHIKRESMPLTIGHNEVYRKANRESLLEIASKADRRIVQIQNEQKNIDMERIEAAKFTHTMRNLLKNEPMVLSDAISRFEKSGLYKKDINYRIGIKKLAQCASIVGLAERLIDIVSITGDNIQLFIDNWHKDIEEEVNTSSVLAFALRQSVFQILFVNENIKQAEKLTQASGNDLEEIRQSFLNEILPLDVNKRDRQIFIDWVSKYFPGISISLLENCPIKFSEKGYKYTFLYTIVSELIYNSLKYYCIGGEPIIMQENINAAYHFTVSNVFDSTQSSGSQRGLLLVNKMCELWKEYCRIKSNRVDCVFVTELSIDIDIFHKEVKNEYPLD